MDFKHASKDEIITFKDGDSMKLCGRKKKEEKTGLLCSAECWKTVSETWWHSLFERLQRVLGVEEMKINKLHNDSNEKEKEDAKYLKSNMAILFFFKCNSFSALGTFSPSSHIKPVLH